MKEKGLNERIQTVALAGLIAIGMLGLVPSAETSAEEQDIRYNATITAYTPYAPNAIATGQCSYPCTITASGHPAKEGIAACPGNIPFGTEIIVLESSGAANGQTYTCEDRGKLGSNHFDILSESRDPYAANMFTDTNATIQIGRVHPDDSGIRFQSTMNTTRDNRLIPNTPIDSLPAIVVNTADKSQSSHQALHKDPTQETSLAKEGRAEKADEVCVLVVDDVVEGTGHMECNKVLKDNEFILDMSQ